MSLRRASFFVSMGLVVSELALFGMVTLAMYQRAKEEVLKVETASVRSVIDQNQPDLIGNLLLRDSTLVRAWVTRVAREAKADLVLTGAIRASAFGSVQSNETNRVRLNIGIAYAGESLGQLSVMKPLRFGLADFAKESIGLLVIQLILAVAGFFMSQSLVRRHILRPILSLTNQIKEGRVSLSFADSGVPEELKEMASAYSSLQARLIEQRSKEIQTEAEAARYSLASKVSHDLRSPLAALEILSQQPGALSESVRSNFLSAVQSIQGMAEQLLESRRADKKPVQSVPEAKGTDQLKPLVDQVIEEQNLLLGSAKAAKFEIRIPAELPLFGPRLDLSRILNNLIRNALEASDLKRPPKIEIEASLLGNLVGLTITDNGKGIPRNIVDRIGEEGFSFGKENGNGLGVWSSRKLVEDWGGRFVIESVEGVGTTIRITVPVQRDTRPQQMIDLRFSPTKPLVMIDDDSLVHASLKLLLGRLPNEERPSDVVHIKSADEFREWFDGQPVSTRRDSLYLFDHDLGLGQETGLDLIWDHGLAEASKLVTGRADDPEVKRRAAQMAVEVVSK